MPQKTESDPEPAPSALEGPWRARPGTAPGLLILLGRGDWSAMQARPDRVAYRVETPAGCFFVKHYTPIGFSARFRDFVSRRKPQRAFAYGNRLLDCGVSTPRPLGLYARGRGVWREALLAIEWLDYGRRWSEHLTEGVSRLQDPAAFRRALSDMAIALGGLHRLGLYHGDLASNVVFAGNESHWRPYVVDLEDLHRRLSRKRRIKNLEELGRAVPDLNAISLRDRWHFLQIYVRAAGLHVREARSLWREGRAAQLRRAERRARRREKGR